MTYYECNIFSANENRVIHMAVIRDEVMLTADDVQENRSHSEIKKLLIN